jgi:hypothetical protein
MERWNTFLGILKSVRVFGKNNGSLLTVFSLVMFYISSAYQFLIHKLIFVTCMLVVLLILGIHHYLNLFFLVDLKRVKLF